jgi:peptidyl-prolyl cis-trans isomerase C
MRAWIGVVLLCVLGCGRPVQPPEAVVARVNDYEVTADEFRRELAMSRGVIRNFPDISPQELKDKVLDELIVRQLLLEEAQKLDIDKQPAFMREVEAYWRQALLKTLLARKTDEFLGGGKTLDEEVREAYERQSSQMQLDVVIVADEASAKVLAASGATYEEAIKNLGAKVVSRAKPGWWMAGDFPAPVEGKIWPLDIGQISSAIFSPQDGWMVVKVVAKEHVAVKPFAEMEAGLHKKIARERTQERMDRWVGELRGRAHIEKNKDLMDQIKLDVAQRTGGGK